MDENEKGREAKLAAVFMACVREDLDPYQDLLRHFDAGCTLFPGQGFPLPPRRLENASAEVREAWDKPWAALKRAIRDRAGQDADFRMGFGEADVIAIARELWFAAAERVEQHFTPSVAPNPAAAGASRRRFTVINGGKAPKSP